MKVVILAGGLGTRLSEETVVKPKPMVEIGGKPILWHIMKIYSHFGFNDFLVCLGYKGYIIKEYFANYFLHQADVVFDIQANKMEVLQHSADPWKVTLVDTGESTMTGGRVLRIERFINEQTFMLTYGDGVSDINISELLESHTRNGRHATVTEVQPSGRFGAMDLDPTGQVLGFREKPESDGAWINGGFFILNRSIFRYISGDSTIWEREPLETLAKDGQLNAFRHRGFWKPMDTLREKQELDNLWMSGKAPWKSWE